MPIYAARGDPVGDSVRGGDVYGNPERDRWVWLLFVPWQSEPVVYAEAPRSPFDSIMLATERETGLFVRPSLPRLK